jgi:hypothetical protein
MSTVTDFYAAPGAAANTETHDSPRKPFWRKIFDRMVAAQRWSAERDIEAFVSKHGGLLTDEIEREMERRLFGGRRPLH